MTPKFDLFELVKSLTEKEVKVFRTEILKRQGDHVYIKVFDGILAQEEYEEEKLKANFKGSKTLNNFSIAKNNLYEKVLEVMCELPHHQNIETKFDLFKQQITILVKKSLYKQAIARVNKALRIAEKLEAYRRVFDLQDILREIGRNFLQPQEYLDMLRSLRAKEAWYMEVEQNLQQYRDLFDTSSIAQKIPENLRLTMINSILSNQLLQDESECRSVSAKLYFFRTWNHLYYIQGRDTGWKYFTKRLLQLLEENDHLLADPGKFLVYINTLSDLGLNAIASNEFAVAMDAAERLKAIRKNLKIGDSEALIFNRYWKIQLLYSQKKLDEKSGLKAVESIKDGLRRYKGKLSKTDTKELTHLCATFLVITDRSSEAIQWILKLRDDKLESSRPDLHYFSWLMFLVAHYNLGHLDVVEQQLPSTIHYMREHKTYTPYVRLVLSFFKKAINTRNRAEEMALVIKTRNEMQALFEETEDYRVQDLFDMLAWFDSIREGMPLLRFLKTSAAHGEN
jgi:hypothetical protein